MPTARNIHELEALLVSSEEDNGIDHVDTVEIRHKLAHRYRAIQNFDKAIISVSYTHLTLPTIYSV